MIGGGADGVARGGAVFVEAVDGDVVVEGPAEFDTETGGGLADFDNHKIDGFVEVMSVVLVVFVIVGEDEFVAVEK